MLISKLWPRVSVQCSSRGEAERSKTQSESYVSLLTCELLSFTVIETIASSLAEPWLFLSFTKPVPRRKERPEAALMPQAHTFLKT